MRKVENQNAEFKQTWNENCLKTICAFANTAGGMVEAWGRGTVKIVDECKKAGLPEPEFREEFGGFSVFFRKGKSGERVEDKLGETEGEILVLIAGDKLISIPVMAEKLGISTGI
jgi:predicted HTH transcriptional regulator